MFAILTEIISDGHCVPQSSDSPEVVTAMVVLDVVIIVFLGWTSIYFLVGALRPLLESGPGATDSNWYYQIVW